VPYFVYRPNLFVNKKRTQCFEIRNIIAGENVLMNNTVISCSVVYFSVMSVRTAHWHSTVSVDGFSD
jgi:hypothetical protein